MDEVLMGRSPVPERTRLTVTPNPLVRGVAQRIPLTRWWVTEPEVTLA